MIPPTVDGAYRTSVFVAGRASAECFETVWSPRIDGALGRTPTIAGPTFVSKYAAEGGVDLPCGGVGTGREKGLVALPEYARIRNVCVTATL